MIERVDELSSDTVVGEGGVSMFDQELMEAIKTLRESERSYIVLSARDFGDDDEKLGVRVHLALFGEGEAVVEDAQALYEALGHMQRRVIESLYECVHAVVRSREEDEAA